MTLARYFEVLTGSALAPGVIAAIQTFGDRIITYLKILFVPSFFLIPGILAVITWGLLWKWGFLKLKKDKGNFLRDTTRDPKSAQFWVIAVTISILVIMGYRLYQPGILTTYGWEFLIPFRISLPLKITSSWFEGRVTHEGYFYPFGFAWTLTLDTKKQMALKDAVQLAFKSRNLSYNVRQPNWTEEQMGAYALAEKCLTWLRESALGAGAPPGPIHANEPFSVFTVIQGSGAIPPDLPVQGGEIHRALEALTTWNQALIRSWGTVQPPALDSKVLLPLKSGTPQDHVVYAQKRGRVVWFPEAFTDTSAKRCTLSCYHKNLSVAALQVESLCAFLKATASEIKNGRWEYLPVMQKECARIAAGIAGRMYGDVEETYRSLSPRYHMDQNKYVHDVNKVRSQVHLKPLEKSAKPRGKLRSCSA